MISFFKNILRKLPIGKYIVVFQIRGVWEIQNFKNQEIRRDYCKFVILHNKIKDHYKLNYSGYCATKHKAYKEMMEAVNDLNNGKKIILNGNLIPLGELPDAK
jgi:hypothetical protein